MLTSSSVYVLENTLQTELEIKTTQCTIPTARSKRLVLLISTKMGGYEDGHLARLQLIGRATHYFGRIALVVHLNIARAMNIKKESF